MIRATVWTISHCPINGHAVIYTLSKDTQTFITVLRRELTIFSYMFLMLKTDYDFSVALVALLVSHVT